MLRVVRGYKGYKFRIYPNAKQSEHLLGWESALRFLWNLALEQRKLGLARPARLYPTAFDQINELTALRAEVPSLADVPRNVCAQLLVELDKAWQRCFSRIARAPRWKRKGKDTLGLTEPHPKVWRLQGRANRSALPVEGALPESTRRSRKVVALRVPRRAPQSSAV